MGIVQQNERRYFIRKVCILYGYYVFQMDSMYFIQKVYEKYVHVIIMCMVKLVLESPLFFNSPNPTTSPLTSPLKINHLHDLHSLEIEMPSPCCFLRGMALGVTTDLGEYAVILLMHMACMRLNHKYSARKLKLATLCIKSDC